MWINAGPLTRDLVRMRDTVTTSPEDDPGACLTRLAGGENRAAQRLRKRDGREVGSGIQVILAALVDHAQLLMRGGDAVGKHLIDLVPLERDLVALVSEAEYKLTSRGHRENLIEVGLDLVLPAPDAGCFIPVEFGSRDRAVRQPHPRDALPLPPASGPIAAPQALDLADGAAFRECLDVRDWADDFEVHVCDLYCVRA